MIYDSTGVKIITTTYEDIAGQFIPDTFYTAGALTLPVTNYHYKSSGGAPWSSGGSHTMKDSLGRKVCWSGWGRSSKSNSRWNKSSSIALSEDNTIAVQYYWSSSSTSGGGGSSADTLIGKSWNSRGMITKGHVKRSSTSSGKMGGTTYSEFDLLIAYDSTLVTPVDSFIIRPDGFQAQLLYKAGDLYVPVVDSMNLEDRFGINIEYYDSLGRMICKANAHSGPGSREHYNIYFNEDKTVRKIGHSGGYSSTVTSSSYSDSLIGKSWNEKGMILDADYYRKSSYTNPGGTSKVDTMFLVTIVYDSTDIVPIDTIYHTETPLVKSIMPQKTGFTTTLEQEHLSLTGLQADELVTVVSANGRVLLQAQADTYGSLRLPLQGLSSGVHFLVTSERRLRFVR